jgi:hypothetical protein
VFASSRFDVQNAREERKWALTHREIVISSPMETVSLSETEQFLLGYMRQIRKEIPTGDQMVSNITCRCVDEEAELAARGININARLACLDSGYTPTSDKEELSLRAIAAYLNANKEVLRALTEAEERLRRLQVLRNLLIPPPSTDKTEAATAAPTPTMDEDKA